MKTVTYMGQTFSVPDGANFIAADDDGDAYAFSEQPILKHGFWKSSSNYDWVGKLYYYPCEAC